MTLLAVPLAGLLALLSVRRKKDDESYAALRLTSYNFIKGITGLCSVIPFMMEAFQSVRYAGFILCYTVL